jgi:hypothetical protein
MSHAAYATLSGALVASAWFVLNPLNLGQVTAAAAGFVVGVVVYLGIAIVDSLSERRTGA